MEYKNIFFKFTLHPQTEYKNIKIEACLQGLLPWDMSFQSNQKIYPNKVSYCQNSDLRIIFRQNPDLAILTWKNLWFTELNTTFVQISEKRDSSNGQ